MSELMRSRRGVASFADVVNAAGQDQPWAIEMLAEEYLPRLASFARARGAVDPEGIADVSLMSVLQRLPDLEFEAREQLWAYLALTARSRVIDEHRRTKPVELVDDTEAIDAGRHSSDPFDERIVEQEYVSNLLEPLTDEQRQVLELRFLEDLSIEETADVTGRTKGAVKGLQRRAINAIIAAVAVALIVLAVRGVGEPANDNDDPAGSVDAPETTTVDRSGDQDRGSGRSDDGGEPEQGALVVGGDDQQPGDGALEDSAAENGAPEDGLSDDGALDDGLSGDGALENAAPEDGLPGDDLEDSQGDEAGGVAPPIDDPQRADPLGDGVGPIRLSAGTGAASAMNATGSPGSSSVHGVRIRCVASHLSHDDPIRFAGAPGAAAAQVHWGNTAADAFAATRDLTATGSGTCDGGITDRSAYWMPALFDGAGQVVVPDGILVEYKAFGGVGFDRQTIQPIPAGLQLTADQAVPGSFGPVGSIGSTGDTVTVTASFPSCVQVDRSGQPVTSSTDRVGHLSYPSNADRQSNGCPNSHPYRIPQLSYRVTYTVPGGSGWYLASETGAVGADVPVTAHAISEWGRSDMSDVVTCIRDLLTNCWFADLDDPAPPPITDLGVLGRSFEPQPLR